jgi:hypothetical protein
MHILPLPKIEQAYIKRHPNETHKNGEKRADKT